MSDFDGFFDGGGGGLPIGTIIQAAACNDPNWLRIDGRDLLRVDYPDLSALFPVHPITLILRNMAQIPQRMAVDTNGTRIVAAGNTASSSNHFQHSTNGTSWTALTYAGFGTNQVACIKFGGTRFVAIDSGGVGAYSNDGLTWNGTTGAANIGGSGMPDACAYSSTLGMFRTSDAYSSDGIAWTLGGSGIAGGVGTGCHWTGQRFISMGTTNVARKSTDGTTWSDLQLPVAPITSNLSDRYGVATDGNGTVVICPYDGSTIDRYSLWVSKDHGDTWRRVTLPPDLQGGGVFQHMQFVNGKFFHFRPNGVVGVSTDGLTWFREDLTNKAASMVYFGGTYVGLLLQPASTTGAGFTATEDSTKFALPSPFRNNTADPLWTPIPAFPEWIKAK